MIQGRRDPRPGVDDIGNRIDGTHAGRQHSGVIGRLELILAEFETNQIPYRERYMVSSRNGCSLSDLDTGYRR